MFERSTIHPPTRFHVAGARRAIGAAVGLTLAMGISAIPSYADNLTPNGSSMGSEPYRPGLHYTPAKNWMNDPNGMVYFNGTYHLFYQYNPQGPDWGNMSWGHATSTDLMNWTEQPVAIGQTFNDSGQSIEDIFSGSIVVDENNSSGLAKNGETPLIALYTSAYTDKNPEHAGKQAQSLAYSLDEGTTWEKYEGNPVLDRNSANFRDPKVFWYEGDTPEESYWVMVAVEATDYKVVLYKSDNLIDWSYLSEFGGANAVGGIWECPDLFPLQVEGDPSTTKWVLVVNLNPGAVAGGSGGQYFVGDFDGTTFTSKTTVEDIPAPQGDVVVPGSDFEGADYGQWTVVNTSGNPFGIAPAEGAKGGQQTVNGFQGKGLVNSFSAEAGDNATGYVTSPEFTIDSNYISFGVGGGKKPHVEGAQLDNTPPEGQLLWNGFEPEGDKELLTDFGWTLDGDFTPDRSPSTAGGDYFIGDKRINTWEAGPNGDGNIGSMTSPEFTIDGDYLSMLIGGGRRTDGSLAVQLLVNGEVVRSVTGRDSGLLNWQSMDLSDLQGETAQVRIYDHTDGGWGHLTVDHFVMGDTPAVFRSEEAAVNLLVDGHVVRSSTGSESEVLDWTTWDVSDLAGEKATIQIVDNVIGGWGHILADHFIATDTPAPSTLEYYDWLDYGRDYYAAVSYFGAPDGQRIMTGWMNNWMYAGASPVSPWRSAMSLPREVTLVRDGDSYELSQKVVDQAAAYEETSAAVNIPGGSLSEGVTPIDETSGDMLKIDLSLNMGDASQAGIIVRAPEGAGTDAAQAADVPGTEIGYDAGTGKIYVDRTRSGNTDFHPEFSHVSSAPAPLENGLVTLSIYVDRSSVEVFGAGGTRTLTDLIYPDPADQSIALFSEGGSASIESLTITPMKQSMFVAGEPSDQSPIETEGANLLFQDTLDQTLPTKGMTIESADQVLAGDFDGDGVDTVVVRNGRDYTFYAANRDGADTYTVTYGKLGSLPVIGDFNGDGKDDLAVRNPGSNVFAIKYNVEGALSGGDADLNVAYGRADDVPLAGNWTGDAGSVDGLGVKRGNQFFLKNSAAGGPADTSFFYGRADDGVVVGDFDGTSGDSVAVVRGGDVFIKNALVGGGADATVQLGGVDDLRLAGGWFGNGMDTLAALAK